MSLLLAFVGAPPAIIETIIAMEFPMLWRAETVTAEELRSRVSGATITRISQDFPPLIFKAGKVKELRSRWV